jgi:hydrogenase maturation protease
MSALLLGVGNILLTDEALGVRTVEQFIEQYNFSADALEVVDGGTAGMELLEMIASRKLVVFVDAVLTGDEAGTIVTLTGKQVPTFFARKLSPHQLGLSDLLSALIMTDEHPEKVIVVGVVPESVEPQIGMTDLISRKMPQILLQVAQTLTQEGIVLTETNCKEKQICA